MFVFVKIIFRNKLDLFQTATALLYTHQSNTFPNETQPNETQCSKS